MPRLIRHLPMFLTLALIAGCGGGEADPNRPETFPITGVVTLDGDPIEGAQITFHSEAGGAAAQSAFGRSDAEGRYTMTTFEAGDGAVAGSYIVTVTKYDNPPPPEEPKDVAMDESYVPPGAPGSETSAPPKNELPTQYSTAQSSELRATVKEGENEIPLELSGG